MTKRRIVNTNQTVNNDVFRRAGLKMGRRKINKFFFRCFILLELQKPYQGHWAQGSRDGAHKGKRRAGKGKVSITRAADRET